MTLIIDHDLTFTQAESRIILNEYVCALCLSDLHIIEIPNHERVFIVCPEHKNVCLTGRVMRSTASMRVERSHREFFPMVAAMPDLFGGIWMNGIPENVATDIVKHCVCALDGGMLLRSLIRDEKGKPVDGLETIVCQRCRTNVGTNGIGFVRQHEYQFIPPLEWRKFLKVRAAAPAPSPFIYDSRTDVRSFDKLGVITYGVRPEFEDEKKQDYFQVTFYRGKSDLAKRLKDILGEEPKQLRVRLPFHVASSSLDCFYKGALTARAVPDGNGWRWEYYRDPDTQEIEIRGGRAITVTGHRLMSNPVDLVKPIFTNRKGKSFPLRHYARLRFILPDLAEVNGKPTPGYFEMSFKDDDAERIKKGVQDLKNECFTFGRMLPEVPLILSLHVDEEGSRTVKIEMEN